MRIVHTSDWHAGRKWRGIDRLDELEAVLDHLAGWVIDHDVDLLLVTGDVFDSGVPPAKAERAVFRFLKRVGLASIPSVVIAGNHDSPARIEAWAQLAELVDVHALGRPRRPDDGGVIELQTRGGECAVVAAVPFASPRTLVSALELAEDDSRAARRYADRFRRLVGVLCERFRGDAVNLLCAHTHLDGAQFTGVSERTVHLGDNWAATRQALPSDAHYVALGHIHRPQRIDAPAPARYAGAPMQLDFGEAGEDKSFVIVDAEPGRPARITTTPYEGARELRVVTGPLAHIEARVDELREAGWLRVVVELDLPDPDINRRVRALLPNAVAVGVQLPASEDDRDRALTLAEATPPEVFRAYWVKQHGREPDSALVDLFTSLHAELEGAR